MKEYKVGEQIVLEVKEISGKQSAFPNKCDLCFFNKDGICSISCLRDERSDGKNIIFVEKKGSGE